ncbi:MAG: hypothetical protein ABJE10_21125 [bacterium]
MGLTLHYELRLPVTVSPEEVDDVLASLHAFARGLPLESVSPILGPRTTLPFDHDGEPHDWLSFWAPIIAEPYDEDVPPLHGDTDSARAFMVYPGDRCESATFGFLSRAADMGGHREWFWRCSCKTQYASVVSDAHFVACHTSLVSLLDHAVTLGVEVTVQDETQYWETRDETRLIDEVLKMNRLMAAFGGRLADALGSEHSLHGEIFAHPRFERLEMGE